MNPIVVSPAKALAVNAVTLAAKSIRDFFIFMSEWVAGQTVSKMAGGQTGRSGRSASFGNLGSQLSVVLNFRRFR